MSNKSHLFGTWSKPVGADWGVVYENGKWTSFACIGCMFAQKLAVPERRIVWSKVHRNAWSRDITLFRHPVHIHDSNLHREWLKAGKPYLKVYPEGLRLVLQHRPKEKEC